MDTANMYMNTWAEPQANPEFKKNYYRPSIM